MATTRHPPPFQIYQDAMHPATLRPQQPKPRPQLQPSAMPLQPLPNGAHIPSNLTPYPQTISPQKMQPLSPPTQSYPDMSYVNIPPPQQAIFPTDSPAKRLQPPPLQQYRPAPAPQQPLFTTFNSNFETYEQENYYQPAAATAHDNAEFPEPSYTRKNTLKRSYSDVAPSIDRPSKKACAEEQMSGQIPDPSDMPPIEDDGIKPHYSYAQMIGMAILRSPHRRLTLAQIYDWIATTFTYYREDTKQGWHNSIRHNLSLSKAFNKIERPKGDAGKGCYWIIVPGFESTFLKDRGRKSGNNMANIQVHSTVMRPDIQSASQPLPELLAPSPFISQPDLLQERPQTAPALPELSSDATLPASDPALHEEDVVSFDLANLQPAQSSPPDAINSSPPVAAVSHRRSESSPARFRRPAAKKHKRNATEMNDSGYYSSLDSSALLSSTHKQRSGIVLTSELDNIRSRRKPRAGRAEDEIQRLRSSSHDVTPSHRRVRSVNFAIDTGSSSPLNPTPPSVLQPTTPAVSNRVKRPESQLRILREERDQLLNVGMPQSPANVWSPLPWTDAANQLLPDNFEVFSDTALSMTPGFASSPLKATKRPSLTRATTLGSATVLLDILGNNTAKLNARTPTRPGMSHNFLKPGSGMTLGGSPLKSLWLDNLAGDEAHDDLINWELDNEDITPSNDNEQNADSDENENEPLDLSKGFGKIGAPVPMMSLGMPLSGQSAGSMKRPGLTRGASSIF